MGSLSNSICRIIVRLTSCLSKITSRVKGYPFEVQIPETIGISGVVLADQLKSLDWRTRDAEYIERIPSNIMSEITDMIRVLIEDDV